MAFLKEKVHIDVVELTETEESYALLADFYYAHQETIKEEYVPTEDGGMETELIEGFEADGWRYRLSVLKESAKSIEELKAELVEEYKRKGLERGYAIDSQINVKLNGTE